MGDHPQILEPPPAPPPPLSPVRAQLLKFRLAREKRTEAIISDDGEHLRHAVENNSWMLIRRLLGVPGKHAETDKIYPTGTIDPVEIEALQEINKRGWTILHALCFHGAPAGLIVYCITRLLTESDRSDSESSSSEDEDSEEEIRPFNWDDEEEVDTKIKLKPADKAKKQVAKKKAKQQAMENPEDPSSTHPVSRLDDMQNNCLHLLFSRSTTEGDGTKRAVRSEIRNTLRIAQTILTFDPSLVRQRNINGHTPLHALLSSTGVGGRISLPLLRLMKKCHPALVQDTTPSGSLPLHLLCLLNSPYELVEAVLDWYPHAVRVLDRKGRTPLHCVLMLKEPKISIIKMILNDYRFALNIVDRLGRTPLITAVVAAGAENPPPLALMRILKSESEWYHPEGNDYGSFDWYAGGTKQHPHVVGCDFDNIDVTTPSVQVSAKVAVKPPTDSARKPKSPRRRSMVRKKSPGNKRSSPSPSPKSPKSPKSPTGTTPRSRRSRLDSQTSQMSTRSRKGSMSRKQSLQHEAKLAEIKMQTNVRAKIQSLVRKRMPGNFNKNLLKVLTPRRRGQVTVARLLVPGTGEEDHPPAKHTFRWYEEGNVSGPDFLGNMPKNKVANKFRDAILQMEEKRHTDGSNGGSNAFLSKRNPNRPHVRYQLSSTMSGQRRADRISQMPLSPRYRDKMQEQALLSRDYERSTIRNQQMKGSLRSKYYQQPILLRRETPEQRRDHRRIHLDLPEHPVDARGEDKEVKML